MVIDSHLGLRFRGIAVGALIALASMACGAPAPSSNGAVGSPGSSPSVVSAEPNASAVAALSPSASAVPSSAVDRNPSALASDVPYAPAIDPASFATAITNPYMPLVPGTVTTFEGPGEQVVVTVTDRTKTIAGVETVVVHDQAFDGKLVVEDTEDYYAQDAAGNVWYFGEVTGECDHGTVTSREGSWEAGVDGAQPGVVMLADPRVGDTYRQEFYAGAAEDQATVLQLDGMASGPTGSYTDVLVTEDVTPLEPDLNEHKSYARGVGVVQEETITPEAGIIALTKMTNRNVVPPLAGSFEPCAG